MPTKTRVELAFEVYALRLGLLKAYTTMGDTTNLMRLKLAAETDKRNYEAICVEEGYTPTPIDDVDFWWLDMVDDFIESRGSS